LCILTETDKQFSILISKVTEIGCYSKKLSINAYWLYAEAEGIDCGLVAFYLNESKQQIYITYLFVYATYRRQHLALRMLDYLASTYQGEFKSIALEVLNSNNIALNFYTKCGFEIMENRKDSYLMQHSIK
jgi:ribosomal protein S18 acetylase RimI-like enzyme